MSEGGEALGSSFESAFASLQVRVLETCGAEDDWRRKVAAGVRAAFEFAISDAAAARTHAAFGAPGTYELELWASDSVLESRTKIAVNVK